MLFAGFVIQQNALLHSLLDDLVGDHDGVGGRRGTPRLYGLGE